MNTLDITSRPGRFALALSFVASLGAASLASGCAFETAGSENGEDGENGEDVEDVAEVGQALVGWPGHVGQAQTYVNQINPLSPIAPNQLNNDYGTPASLSYPAPAGVLVATTECGSFTALLLQNTYPSLAAVFSTILGTSSPTAAEWHDHIAPGAASACASGICLVRIDAAAGSASTGRTLSYLQVGDILASKYVHAGATGHVMTVGEIGTPSAPKSLSGTHAIPGVTLVIERRVKVYDSTSSVHSASNSLYTDTRYLSQCVPPAACVNDRGIGAGYLYLYESADASSTSYHQLVGWTWSTVSAYTYEFTDATLVDDKGATIHRPMVIGRFTGIPTPPAP